VVPAPRNEQRSPSFYGAVSALNMLASSASAHISPRESATDSEQTGILEEIGGSPNEDSKNDEEPTTKRLRLDNFSEPSDNSGRPPSNH